MTCELETTDFGMYGWGGCVERVGCLESIGAEGVVARSSGFGISWALLWMVSYGG